MKRLTAICLSILMFASSITVYANEEEYTANSWRYENGEPIVSQEEMICAQSDSLAWVKENGVIYNGVGDPIPNAISKGIDVSEWQGDIDWDKVKKTDVEFAILRCGFAGDYAKYDDKKFVRNVNECIRVGMPYGIYLYSYAQTVEDAKEEAAHTLRLLKGLNPSYPVFYDLEDYSVMSSVSKSTIAQIAKTYVTTIQNAGYNCGVYANLNWFTNYLTDPYFDSVMKWVAQYNVECNYMKPYIMWQGTSSGYVDGIAGRVDIDVTFNSLRKLG
jgi:GH25 family lysozyme M1 (1,4-beta-N-acetylmuramidase)